MDEEEEDEEEEDEEARRRRSLVAYGPQITPMNTEDACAMKETAEKPPDKERGGTRRRSQG